MLSRRKFLIGASSAAVAVGVGLPAPAAMLSPLPLPPQGDVLTVEMIVKIKRELYKMVIEPVNGYYAILSPYDQSIVGLVDEFRKFNIRTVPEISFAAEDAAFTDTNENA